MNTLRYVVFVENRVAEEMAEGKSDVYTGAFIGRCQLDGLYPLSPVDIKQIVSAVPEFEHKAIVEAYMPYHELGIYKEIRDCDIISVNKIIQTGTYAPLRRVDNSCAFNTMTDLDKDELGWHHPMVGISWLRNRQCMKEDKYIEMMEKLAKHKGRIYVKCLEDCFLDSLMTEYYKKEYSL